MRIVDSPLRSTRRSKPEWLFPRVGIITLCLGLLALGAPSEFADAQVRPIYGRGAQELTHRLERLTTISSAMHIGAHPDDEDSALIARLARGNRARIAYLSLNRGEGGQNVIGPELFEALGVIRSEELLQARRLDGGDQFFTRAVDYGFSKTLKEASQKWDEDALLGDIVRAIRRYRPLVLIARFTGTPADGHGQHQLAGYLSPLAYRAAGDPSRFPEHLEEGLRPWQPLKLYVSEGFRPHPDNPPSLYVDTGGYDPVYGRTYFEIAMEGRSQHRSQGMGTIELRGAQRSGMRLLESERGADAENTGVFDAIDTSITGIAAVSGLPKDALRDELREIATVAREALERYQPRAPQELLPLLAKGVRDVRAARARLADMQSVSGQARSEADFLLSQKEEEFIGALIAARGLVLDALSDRETVTPGSSLLVSVRAFYPPGDPIHMNVELDVPEGSRVEPASRPEPQGRFRFRQEKGEQESYFRVGIAGGATPSGPYFLRSDKQNDMYVWGNEDYRGEPFAPASFRARVVLDISGVSVTRDLAILHRRSERDRGELRRNVQVVPRVSMNIEPTLSVVPLGPQGSDVNTRTLAVQITNHSTEPSQGSVSLQVPQGWKVQPESATFSLAREGQSASMNFEVEIPAGAEAGAQTLTAQALVEAQAYDQSMQTIAYPHMQTHRLYRAASSVMQLVDLKLDDLRVGYVMGSGDKVPEAIRRMGIPLNLLSPEELATGNLSAYDTIVVGIRASQVRPDFVSSHGRLLDFVRAGGTLITQYQQTDYVRKELAPFPIKMERPENYSNHRITDETAAMTILEPDHPAFNRPNRINDTDWNGWVQERSLYHFSEWDDAYTPLIESADPDEAPHRGSLLVAEFGEGHYVYSGISFFRQLPAGVPGAYRLFANLLSLGH